MSAGPPHSKNAVTRAGRHLAANLLAVRAGERERVVDPHDGDDLTARDAVRWWLEEHVEAMSVVRDRVRFTVAVVLEDEPWPRVTSRSKRFETVVDKLTRHPGGLAGMVDLGGVRLVAAKQEDVDELVGELVAALDVRRVVDHARDVPASGYRAIHLHVRHDGRNIEVQARTEAQHRWANAVEQETLASGLNYKAGFGHPEVLAFFRELSATYAVRDGLPASPQGYRAALEAARPYFRSRTLKEQ